ncbi:TonB-dependent receptor [Sphingomonas rhizophila]|uniref:TonB-dependent receptor n=1 Tax=Sphingomonas rhizophila TaxID=2071607 RepID=A0A7G9SDH7_9SPHN|nr:TonB-dependent receptor [Sphingomonas rhizophila]
MDGGRGRLGFGTSLSAVGKRIDTDFDQFPAKRLTLSGYALVNARLAYRLTNSLELTLRTANLLDARYVDAIGYRTEGRSVHVGLRVSPRR